jgi:DUF1680 family protein
MSLHSGPAIVTDRGILTTLTGGAVELTGGLLAAWQERNRAATIPHTIRQLREAGALTDIRTIADSTGEPRIGRYPFHDTDVYKTLEGIAYEIARGLADEMVLAFWEEAIDLLQRAQAPDGYLNSFVQNDLVDRTPWDDLTWGHELYNLGHLVQAAIAASRQVNDDRLLGVALRFADLAVERFGTGSDVCGHPEIEMALVELGRHTGDRRYTQLAADLVERRGRGALPLSIFPAPYFQDHQPFRSLDSVTGHAVRMAYLAAGATDVAIETGDADLLAASVRLFDDMVDSSMYLTGGVGSRHSDEAIGDRFELPSERAYAETCAAIGVMQWAWRLMIATGESRFGDTYETVLHNVYAAGISLDGRSFFYDNPLQRRLDSGRFDTNASDPHHPRRAWFTCPCCPPNVVRWMSELQDHIALVDDAGLHLVVFADAVIDSPRIGVTVRTHYPDDGLVRITVDHADPWALLAIRIPEWASSTAFSINTDPITASTADDQPTDGWLRLTRDWAEGDEIVVDLAMPVRFHGAHPSVDAIRGAIAVARGPVVYCAEQQDQTTDLDRVVLEPLEVSEAAISSAATSAAAVSAGDVSSLATPTPVVLIQLEASIAPVPDRTLYPELPLSPAAPHHVGTAALVLIPYRLWGNRGSDAMRVWFRGR